MTHYNLVHKIIPMLQAKKIPDAKALVDKEWKKLQTIPPLCYIDGHLSSQKCGVRTKISEVSRSTRTLR